MPRSMTTKINVPASHADLLEVPLTAVLTTVGAEASLNAAFVTDFGPVLNERRWCGQ
jgi:hypothetical protein